MEHRRIGSTDLLCSPVGFGTWEMSTTMYGDIDVAEARRAVQIAIDHGINLFDTAEVYGPFHSEELLAKALGSRRKEVILVDKIGFQYDASGKITGRNSGYEAVIEHTESCLHRMQTDTIDLLLIHWRDFDTPLEETVRALEKVRSDGKIRNCLFAAQEIDIKAALRNGASLAELEGIFHAAVAQKPRGHRMDQSVDLPKADRSMRAIGG